MIALFRDLGVLSRETWSQMKRAQLLLVASSLAYISILAIIPMLAVSFAIFRAFGGMERLYATAEPFILRNLAQGSSDQAIEILQKFVTNVRGRIVGVGGFVSLVLTTLSLLANIESAIHRVWDEPIRRGIFKRLGIYFLAITVGPLALSIAFGLAESGYFPIAKLLPGGAILYLIAVAVFFILYKVVPSSEVHAKWALIAAVLTAALWSLAGRAYGHYVLKVVRYDRIYGSLGAVPIFLLWVYILWVIILSGAALTAALQQRGDPLTHQR